MADERRAGSSENKCSLRRSSRRKQVKPAEVVEISDSSSESNDEETVPIRPTKSTVPTTPVPPASDSSMECPVCLQPCIHPARLPCGHVFCFLCLKGIAQQSRRCAMCRQEIAADYLDKPDLLEAPNPQADKEETFEDGYQWFYEGRNGWWQYDERTSRELEAAYKSGVRTCELLIAGFLYTADFDAMLQCRRAEPHRRRRIKRDLATITKKGVAGIRYGEVDAVTDQLSSLTVSDTTVVSDTTAVSDTTTETEESTQ